MTNQFVWIPTCIDMPNDNRIVIIQCDILDDPTFGVYDREKDKWDILDLTIVNESSDELEINVVAWMNMPTPYTQKENFKNKIRSARETRFLMSELSKEELDNDALSLAKVRGYISSNVRNGFCTVPVEELTEKVISILRKKKYKVENHENRYYTVSWD